MITMRSAWKRTPTHWNEWHHIVEQCQIKRSGFAAETIQNVNNVINISKETHRLISGIYSSVPDPLVFGIDTHGMILRNWLTNQSFQVQNQIGLKILKYFGVLR